MTGIIIITLGAFVIIFDYPQILYFEEMSSTDYALLDSNYKDIHQRLLIELAVGIAIVSVGSGLTVLSLIRENLT